MSSPPSSSPPGGKTLEELRGETDSFPDAQIISAWEDIRYEDDQESLQPVREQVNDQHSEYKKFASDVTKAQDLTIECRQELEGAKILQGTSSALEQRFAARLQSLAATTPGVSEAMDEATGTRSSIKEERERYQNLIASSKEQDQKTQDVLRRLEDQMALKSQSARDQHTASALKSLLIFALRQKSKTLTHDVQGDLELAIKTAESHPRLTPRFLDWQAAMTTEASLHDAAPCEVLELLFSAHQDPVKITSDGLSRAIGQLLRPRSLSSNETVVALSVLKTTVVRMLEKLLEWTEDHLIFALRVLQLLSYHYPDASFLDVDEMKQMLRNCKGRLRTSQIEHTCLIGGLEDLVHHRFSTDMAGVNNAPYVHNIASKNGREVPGLQSEQFVPIADGGDLLILTKPISQTAIRIINDGTFYLEAADDFHCDLLCVPNLLKEGETWKHEMQTSQEKWYSLHLPKTCRRYLAQV